MKPLQRWLAEYIGPYIGAIFIRLLGMSLRVKLTDQTGYLTNSLSTDHQTFFFAFWHNRILMLPLFYQKFLPQRKLAVMISRSRDGEMIAQIAAHFGVEAVRGSSAKQGSSSKKSIHAFRQMLREFEQNHKDLGITPDGPRGPRHKVQPGVILLSQMSGLPIIPVTCNYKSKWELPSWDRFQIPKPFTSCEVILGKPLSIPSDASDSQIEDYALQLETLLGS